MHPWRPITATDRAEYLAMATAFYNTDAVAKPIPRSHMEATFDEMMRSNTYASAYICEIADGIVGYAQLAKTFSQEAGGHVLWIEELYLKDGYRHQGLGRRFFTSLLTNLPADIRRVRLEVERVNVDAVRLYRSFGFDFLEYDQMILDR